MININTPKTQLALEKHWQGLVPILTKRIKGTDLTISECESIIKCKPEEMLETFNSWENQGKIQLKPEKNKDGKIVLVQYIGKKKIRNIFNYSEFNKKENEEKGNYGAYQLAKNLDIHVCPYCNRMYTVTVITRKTKFVTRPEFDHFLPQSSYPLFALSFYNLIPSCKICNSTVKGARELDLHNYTHPYIDNDITKFSFDYTLQRINQVKEILINVQEKSKISNTLEFFKIKEIYNEHKDIVENLIQFRDVFSEDYLKSLNNAFPLSITKEVLYLLIFGTYYEETEFYKRPFSKLKKDIVKKLNL